MRGSRWRVQICGDRGGGCRPFFLFFFWDDCEGHRDPGAGALPPTCPNLERPMETGVLICIIRNSCEHFECSDELEEPFRSARLLAIAWNEVFNYYRLGKRLICRRPIVRLLAGCGGLATPISLQHGIPSTILQANGGGGGWGRGSGRACPGRVGEARGMLEMSFIWGRDVVLSPNKNRA